MGQMVSALIHIGDRLDLFKVLAEEFECKFVTTAQLAAKTGNHQRWLMEWLRGMVSAKILQYEEGDDDTEKFAILPEMAQVLANDKNSLVFAAGAFSSVLHPALSDGLVRAFKTGVGMSYRDVSLALGPNNAVETKRLLGTWTRLALVQIVLAALGGGKIVKRLTSAGARVLDVGCGAGVASNCIAKAFPSATVHGVDPDHVALGIARHDAAGQGLQNVTFFDGFAEKFVPPEGKESDQGMYDLAICLDIIHDCPFPDKVLGNVHSLLKPGGVLLIKDIKSSGSFPQNLQRIPTLAMLYGFSVTSCLSSSMSDPGGMGLGTVGFSPPVSKRMCEEAGFVNWTMHDFKDPNNLYYEMNAPPRSGSGRVLEMGATSAIDRYVDLSDVPAPAFCACHGGVPQSVCFRPKGIAAL